MIEVARFESPAFVVGAALPQVDIHIMLNDDNVDRLKATIAEQLETLSYVRFPRPWPREQPVFAWRASPFY